MKTKHRANAGCGSIKSGDMVLLYSLQMFYLCSYCNDGDEEWRHLFCTADDADYVTLKNLRPLVFMDKKAVVDENQLALC